MRYKQDPYISFIILISSNVLDLYAIVQVRKDGDHIHLAVQVHAGGYVAHVLPQRYNVPPDSPMCPDQFSSGQQLQHRRGRAEIVQKSMPAKLV